MFTVWMTAALGEAKAGLPLVRNRLGDGHAAVHQSRVRHRKLTETVPSREHRFPAGMFSLESLCESPQKL